MRYKFISIALFLGIISWFKIADVYHSAFFHSGAIVVAYNLIRLAFVFAMTWVIYSTGYLGLRFFNLNVLDDLSVSEQYLLGFGAGVGIWHVIMLILGLMNLYFMPVVALLCGIVLALSSAHLEQVVISASRQFKRVMQSPLQNIATLVIVFALLFALGWVFIAAALYPAGGHDYFTHYFHYYMNVIKQHGLSPNDVWYHYYYSKGAGLHFMGILLSDPLSPALMTYICVMSAAVALYSLTNRLLPRTMWPLLCVVAFMFYYILPFSGNGGEFQKTHEEVSALMVMTVWALSLLHVYQGQVRRAIAFTLSFVLIALVITTQAISIFLAVYFAIMLMLAIVRKNYSSAREQFYFATLVSVTTIFMLALNYLATGLVTDQELNLAWRYANIEKLKEWGVLPNVMLVAWIRDNYQTVALPWNVANAWQEVVYYTRSQYLSFAILCSFVPVGMMFLFKLRQKCRNKMVLYAGYIAISCLLLAPLYSLKSHRRFLLLDKTISFFIISKIQLAIYFLLLSLTFAFLIMRIKATAAGNANTSLNKYEKVRYKILLNTVIFIATFALLSAIFGRSQITSYYRFSSFFFPLIVLACAMAWCYANHLISSSWSSKVFFQFAVPVMVAMGFIVSREGWVDKAYELTPQRMKFAVGDFSIADAYQRQNNGFPFGAIHPGTWEAVQQIPHGERVWSTTVVSYCMAPDCYVESVISYKFSPHMSEILSGTPQQAKKILQAEGLNYFLFLSEYPMLDYLPYSKLFKPENISKYFSIKWSDNKTFLLTWKNEHDKPISADFLKLYSSRLSEKEDPSFKFSQSIVNLKTFMDQINQQQLALHPINFPWQDNQRRRL